MKNDFTPSQSAMNHPSRSTGRLENEGRRSHPRRSTVMFIKQFARVYNCSPVLPPALGAMIAN